MKGKPNKESFYINGSDDRSDVPAENDDDMNDENNDFYNSPERIVQENFRATLINMIKSEAKSVFMEVNSVDSIQLKSKTFENTSLNADTPKESILSNENNLVDILKNEISFLRSEINSKDEIIKLLITDRNIPQQITNKDNSYSLLHIAPHTHTTKLCVEV